MSHIYKQISPRERDQIAVWKGKGLSNIQIARKLGRSVSTIGRELTRNRFSWNRYIAIHAQERYAKRVVNSHRRHPLKDETTFSYVLEKLGWGWSPEQIAGRLRLEKNKNVICHETIYSFIYQKKNQTKKLWEYLPRKQKRRQKQTGQSSQKVQIAQRVSIHERPIAIDRRNEFGHWEGDTVEGKKSEKDGVHTEVERLSRRYLLVKVNKIDSSEGIRAQYKIFGDLPPQSRRSTTLDNGRENHSHFELWKLGINTYFADPFSSWQRGTNENSNGLFRRYYPKGSSFRDLSQEDLDEIAEEINSRPRKCLGYNTANEVFESYLRGCTSN